MPDNVLYYGDNLAILRHRNPVYIPDESVDLMIYLDPPTTAMPIAIPSTGTTSVVTNPIASLVSPSCPQSHKFGGCTA